MDINSRISTKPKSQKRAVSSIQAESKLISLPAFLGGSDG